MATDERDSAKGRAPFTFHFLHKDVDMLYRLLVVLLVAVACVLPQQAEGQNVLRGHVTIRYFPHSPSDTTSKQHFACASSCFGR